MKKCTIKKKIIYIIMLILICLCVCVYVVASIIDDICIYPQDELNNINKEQVESQVNELFMTFTDEDFMTIKRIFDDIYAQRKVVDHWPTPSDEGKKYISQFDDYSQFLFPKALIIGDTGDDYMGLKVVRSKEEVGMLCEFGVFRPESCHETAHYGICYFYDINNIDKYIDETFTPYYYYHPVCINYLFKKCDNVYLYIYYTTDDPNP